ncbi:MAG: hypothetical protein GY761_14090 [Hyphomicrobiales bacterium]|nr:hypothetical protein [Hyphomicrobiales bacterium]
MKLQLLALVIFNFSLATRVFANSSSEMIGKNLPRENLSSGTKYYRKAKNKKQT